METKNYGKFLLMLVCSFVIMYAVMFLNADRFDHVYLSTTRLYMTLLMVSPMAVLMIMMMPGMYKDKRLNSLIILMAFLTFGLSVVFLRSQTFISDVQYMKGMIPHHSSAILASEEADLQDPEVKKLAEKIVSSQKREISEMKALLQRLEH
jgi:uncharacterized protein (DUF305 family)